MSRFQKATLGLLGAVLLLALFESSLFGAQPPTVRTLIEGREGDQAVLMVVGTKVSKFADFELTTMAGADAGEITRVLKSKAMVVLTLPAGLAPGRYVLTLHFKKTPFSHTFRFTDGGNDVRQDLAAVTDRCGDTESNLSALAARCKQLEDLLVHFSLVGNDIYIKGANLHVVNGSGSTNSTNGLGNIIIGYNSMRSDEANTRTGSHMLVAGDEHNYSGYGGIVVGGRNTTTGGYASVGGGHKNTASGWASSVGGGLENTTSGSFASISGGINGTASGYGSSISGGWSNTSSHNASSVSGGVSNTASYEGASVSGGHTNTASFYCASVSGGKGVTADDWYEHPYTH